MGVIFCIHLAIFFAYLILKLWDMVIKKSVRFIYRVFVFIEYSFMISGFLFCLPFISFSIFVNYKYGSFQHSYFSISFVVALLYFLVFIFFWIYFLVRTLDSNEFFQDPVIYNRYFYFFCQMKKNRGARTFDLIQAMIYFIIGLLIAVLCDSFLPQTILVFLAIIFLILYIACQRPYEY